MNNTDVDAAERFIGKWKGSAASELSTSQSFLIELCELLGVERPHATAEQDYMFERPLTFQHADGSRSAGRVDLYRRGAFVLESKKLKAGAHTRGFDEAMLRAHSQAQNYARALPAGRRGRPPFPVETMLRIHFMQQWFGLSDPAMEEALFDVPLYREFAGLDMPV